MARDLLDRIMRVYPSSYKEPERPPVHPNDYPPGMRDWHGEQLERIERLRLEKIRQAHWEPDVDLILRDSMFKGGC